MTIELLQCNNNIQFILALCFWSFLGVIRIDSRATRIEKVPGAHLRKVYPRHQAYTASAWKQPPLGSQASSFFTAKFQSHSHTKPAHLLLRYKET